MARRAAKATSKASARPTDPAVRRELFSTARSRPSRSAIFAVWMGSAVTACCGWASACCGRARAVIGAGVILTRGTPVYDLERKTVHRAQAGSPLVIPENAVVVPGARSIKDEWAQGEGLSLQTPIIVKYRDEKTDAATALESWLR